MTNTLAYYYKATIIAIKSFIVQAPGAIVIKNTVVNYHGNFNPTDSRVKILR